MSTSTLNSEGNEKKYMALIMLLSVAVPVLVAALLFAPSKIEGGEWTKALPHLNGLLNTATSVALLLGFYFIKNKNIINHRYSMMSAFAMGTLFLVSYVIYHSTSQPTRYGGEGILRTIYFIVLFSHILLAAIVVPFVLLAVYYGISHKIERHKSIARWTFPIWLYVSVTGVVAYLMICPYYK
ncbi:MAG: DUF420 domain-containing protein [Cytophagales bacterium]|nr:DUF420 domain-containing protein [Cytophagales bacterium]